MLAMADKWEKVLYKNHNFPDNYVDCSYLSDLRKNVNLHNYSLREAFTGISVVTNEISATVLFVVTYICMKEDMLTATTVVSGVAALLVLWALVQQWLDSEWWPFEKAQAYEYTKSCIIFLAFGYTFSPILKTLTQSVSTDTVYAMVVFMLVVHVLCQDYGTDAMIVSSSVSLNSALFAAVCLASRLPTVQHTFVSVVLAVMFFVVLPLIRKKIREDTSCLLWMTALFVAIASISLTCISTVYASLFVLFCFCINLLFPGLFVYCQKYKLNIFGPWDEAIVRTE